jgi:UMF1 family MFS transporter
MYLGLANSAYAAMIAVCAPILGAIADQGRRKKLFLIGFTIFGIITTLLLPVVGRGQYLLAALLFTLACYGYSGMNTFCDSLLTDVAEPAQFNRVSSFAFSLGYFGSAVLFIFNTLMVTKPAWFGFGDGPQALESAVKACFVTVSVWWLVMTIPSIFWVRQSSIAPESEGEGSVVARGFRQFKKTFHELKQHKTALVFLAAYILYIDGVNTVISMAVDFGQKIGLDSKGIILSIHLVQWVAIPSTIIYGRIGEKIGPKKAIFGGILVYTGIVFWAFFMTTLKEYFVMAGVVGMVQGGVQALSRSYFAKLIPLEKSGEFFGFYNMMGKFAAIIGPALMGISAALVGPRSSILSLLILFAAGSVILFRVPEAERA